MEHGFSTFSINTIDNKQIDRNNFFKQQKEIESMLSTAFDDITSIQQLSDNEDDENNVNDNENIFKNTDKLLSNHLNGFDHSTPLNNRNIKTSIIAITNGKLLQKQQRNISDIAEEDTIIDVESIEDFDVQHQDDRSDLSLSDHNYNGGIAGGLIDFQIDKQQNHENGNQNLIRSVETILDDDVQLKDLYLIKEEFAQINTNYDLLQSKYQNLHQMNERNVSTIEILRSRIKALEKELKDEKNSVEKERRKTSMFESKVVSLEYQLNEFQKGDYLSKNNEEQMKVFETLKLSHQKELNDLREDYERKIDKLTQTIHSKDDELIANCNLILKYKQEVKYFQNQIQTIENEMKTKLQQEIKSAKEQTELSLLKSFDDSMKKLKNEWEQKLQEDIDKIVDWFENWNVDQQSMEDLDIKFEKLIDVCNTMKRTTLKREQQIQAQIDRMDDARRQLERALLEVRLRNSSLSSTSSRSDLHLEESNQNSIPIQINGQTKKMEHWTLEPNQPTKSTNDEKDKTKMIANLKHKYEKELKDIREQFESELDLLRVQLLNKEEETCLLKRKSNKYKQHYQLLVDKHKQELNLLKNEFTKVMQDLMNNKQT